MQGEATQSRAEREGQGRGGGEAAPVAPDTPAPLPPCEPAAPAGRAGCKLKSLLWEKRRKKDASF